MQCYGIMKLRKRTFILQAKAKSAEQLASEMVQIAQEEADCLKANSLRLLQQCHAEEVALNSFLLIPAFIFFDRPRGFDNWDGIAL